MPLLLKKQIEDCGIMAVWEIQEDISFFIKQLNLDKEENIFLDAMRPHRQKEWLTSRYLLHLISHDSKRKKIVKDNFGKPHRLDCNKHIAISHSKEMVAVAIASKPIGIDVQKYEDRISRIQHKFVSDEEAKCIPENQKDIYYHIFWGAKESMYKAYGKKELAFKKHMHLFPFIYLNQTLEIAGWVRKNEIHQNYILTVQKLKNYFLIYSLLENEK